MNEEQTQKLDRLVFNLLQAQGDLTEYQFRGARVVGGDALRFAEVERCKSGLIKWMSSQVSTPGIERTLPGIERALVLSTRHMPSSEPMWGSRSGSVRVSEHEYGFIVFVSDDVGNINYVPEWLRPIYTKAQASSCTMINFDSDANELEEFKAYGW